MTGSDPIKWGKYKGTPLKDIDRGYFKWLMRQEGFATKNPELANWITNGDQATSTPVEREVLATEEVLLNSVSTPFRQWWFRSYGDRLRKDGEVHYIAYLRAAIGAWEAASKQLATEALPPRPQPPPFTVPKPGEVVTTMTGLHASVVAKMLPSPTPKPQLSALDEDVPF